MRLFGPTAAITITTNHHLSDMTKLPLSLAGYGFGGRRVSVLPGEQWAAGAGDDDAAADGWALDRARTKSGNGADSPLLDYLR